MAKLTADEMQLAISKLGRESESTQRAALSSAESLIKYLSLAGLPVLAMKFSQALADSWDWVMDALGSFFDSLFS